MIIKKYQAMNETEAIILARQELGKDAIVMNIKKISPKGVYRIFKKPQVEVTAAVDDTKSYTPEEPKNNNEAFFTKNKESDYSKHDTSAIEEKINNLQKLIEKQLTSKENEFVKKIDEIAEKEAKRCAEERVIEAKKDDKAEECISLVRKQLMKHEVADEYIDVIINEVRSTIKKDSPVDNILTSIYQKIVLKLGQPSIIETGDDKPKYIFFMGPTGVGKTTTIAKIASDFKINKKLNVALLTSDTYRIAAVEQLRVYANILKIPLNVVYTADEIKKLREELDKFDVVLIDTAGRNHKNGEQKNDLIDLIDSIEVENREIYLVLSATTKYTDLKNIFKAYVDIKGYKLLFTKIDETINLGNILNIKMLTDAELSYVAYGQDVPNDISKLDAQIIAKQLLGGE